ncbi:hypothetical protein GCM10027452_29090 [Micromonospora halotolerans]
MVRHDCLPGQRLGTAGPSVSGHKGAKATNGNFPPDARVGYRRRVIPVEATAAAYAQWLTPALPLYGNDHERADFAP